MNPALAALIAFGHDQLGHALIMFGLFVLADVALGVVPSILRGQFQLRRLKDFVVTTVGYQQLVAFLLALALLLVSGNPVTAAAVSGLCLLYSGSVLHDLIDKLRALSVRPVPTAVHST